MSGSGCIFGSQRLIVVDVALACRPDGKKKAYVRLTADHDALDVANKVSRGVDDRRFPSVCDSATDVESHGALIDRIHLNDSRLVTEEDGGRDDDGEREGRERKRTRVFSFVFVTF